MPDDQNPKLEEIVEKTYGPKIHGHDIELGNLKEKVDTCYVKGGEDFRNDAAKIVSETIQRDEDRGRIKKYAKEAADELWKEKWAEKTERSFRLKQLWVPIIFMLIVAIVTACLTAWLTN